MLIYVFTVSSIYCVDLAGMAMAERVQNKSWLKSSDGESTKKYMEEDSNGMYNMHVFVYIHLHVLIDYE